MSDNNVCDWEGLLDASDKIMDYEYGRGKVWDSSKIKEFSFKVKGSPGNGVKLAQGVDMTSNFDKILSVRSGNLKKAKEEQETVPARKWEHAFKTELEAASKKGPDCSAKLTSTSKDHTLELTHTPASMGVEGVQGVVTMEGKTALSGGWEGSLDVNTTGWEVGPLKAATGLTLSTDNEQNHEVNQWKTIKFDDVTAGYSLTYNHPKKELTEKHLAMAYDHDKDTRVYFRGTLHEQLFGLGARFKLHPKGGAHTAELQYCTADKKADQGMFGKPLFLRWGGKWNLSNGQVLKSHMNWGKQWIHTNKWEVPVSKEVKVTVTDQVNVLNFFADPANMAYKMGFAVEFSM